MKLGSVLARAVQRIFGLLVRINPFSRLDTYLLSHAPIVWRTQFFLVSSYALLVTFVLHAQGRSTQFRTLKQVPTEADLAFRGWLTLVVTLAFLTPWIYRNVQTRLERARPRDVGLLFGAYALCFYCLSLVPTAYTSGAVHALARFPIKPEIVAQDTQRMDRLTSLNPMMIIDDAGDQGFLWIDQGKITLQMEQVSLVQPAVSTLKRIYDHYGLSTCVDGRELYFDSSTSGEIEGQMGVACTPDEIAKLVRVAGSGAVLSYSSVAILTAVDASRASSMTIDAFRSRLRLVSRSQHAVPAHDGWHHPLATGRMLGTLILALLATWLSCRALLGPVRWPAMPRLPLPTWKGGQSLAARDRRRAMRFRMEPPQSIAIGAIWPNYLMSSIWFMAAGVLLLFGLDNSRYRSLLPDWLGSWAGNATSTYLAISVLMLLVAVPAAIGFRKIWSIYRLYTLNDILAFGIAYYRPGAIVAGLLAIGTAIVWYVSVESRDNTISYALWSRTKMTEAVFMVGYGSALCVLLAAEVAWLGKMMAFSRFGGVLSIRGASGVIAIIYVALVVTSVILMAITADSWITSISADPTSAKTIVSSIVLVVSAVLCFALWEHQAGWAPLPVAKFVFSLLLALQIFVLAVACNVEAFVNVMTEFVPEDIAPAILFAFLTACWFTVTARFTMRPFLRNWARALQNPVSN